MTSTKKKKREPLRVSVVKADRAEFLEAYRKLCDSGVSGKALVPALKRFFKDPRVPLKDPAQLYAITRRFVIYGDAPESFKQWYLARTARGPVPKLKKRATRPASANVPLARSVNRAHESVEIVRALHSLVSLRVIEPAEAWARLVARLEGQ